MGETKLLKQSNVVEVGQDDSLLRFVEGDKHELAWAGQRYLYVGTRRTFHLSYWCGTCPFFFGRQEDSDQTLSIERLEETLNRGLDDFDADVLDAFGSLLPRGRYIPMLLEIAPRLILPRNVGEYPSEEELDRQAVHGFWGRPGHHHTPYYCGASRAIGGSENLYEYIVPMVPPSWNDAERVALHKRLLERDSRPTAVSLSIVDITYGWEEDESGEDSEEEVIHWGLVHFMLDGHHKLQAAAETSRPLRLLSFFSTQYGVAAEENASRVPRILATSS